MMNFEVSPMSTRIAPIGPAALPPATVRAASTAQQQRAVQAQVDVLGGANNASAQSSVQKQQDAETRKKTDHLIDRRIVTATLAALEPVGSAHDEDEEDAEREQDIFGSDWPFGQVRPKNKKHKGA